MYLPANYTETAVDLKTKDFQVGAIGPTANDIAHAVYFSIILARLSQPAHR